MLHKGLYGAFHNHDCEFTFFDSKEKYEINLKKLPNDWEYRNKIINYKYNQYGHRSVEPNTLSDDYFLFTGCSITEGVGLKLEDTYPHIVAKYYNKDYYNLAVGGSGTDLLTLNMLSFLLKFKKPSKIFIQLPEENRFFLANNTNNCVGLFNPSSEETNIWKFYIENEISLRQNIYFYKTLHMILEDLKINEIYNLEHVKETSYIKNFNTRNIYLKPVSDTKARDLSHPGSINHRIWANQIINYEKNKT
jgi:hypothetical protein